MNEQFSIQPHWVHKEGMIHGLSTVLLEKGFSEPPQIPRGFSSDPLSDLPEVDLISLIGYGAKKLGHRSFSQAIIHEAVAYQAEVLSEKARTILEQNNPRLKQVYVTFSNGGYPMHETLKLLPPEYRETVVVISVGTTTIIDKDLACKAYNIIGDKDWPSLTCNGGTQGILAAGEKANIIKIPQTETKIGIGGHYFLQPDYQDKINEIITDEVAGNYDVF